MKGLYIQCNDTKLFPNFIGVNNKIQGQIKSFKNNKINLTYVHPYDGEVICNEKIIDKYVFSKNIKSLTVLNNLFLRSVYKNIIKNNEKYDFVYIRFSYLNLYLYKVVKYLKSNSVKVFIEIPTYPYKKELSIKHRILFGGLDKLLNKFISKYVYKYILTNNMSNIYGKETINIFNAIDINSINLKRNKRHNNIINLVGVANVSKWHGYDRVIKGIAEYNKNKNEKNEEVNFHIIGSGEEITNLKELSKDLEVEKNVFFEGIRYGDDLNSILDEMDIGISSLALFRIGGVGDPIKTKEFVGRGMPVIIGYDDLAIKKDLPFIMKINEDESSLNIEEVISFKNNLTLSSNEIREFAVKNLTWDSQIIKIIEEVDRERTC